MPAVLYSRSVVGWATRLHRSLCVQVLGQALKSSRPPRGMLHHSDRGSQYAGADYRALLGRNVITSSMSRPGRLFDNTVAESFFATVKKELDAAFALPPPSRCAADLVLRSRVSPPGSEPMRARVEALQAELARVKALEDAGLGGEALALAQPLAAAVADVPYPPLRAEALAVLARLQRVRGELDAARRTYREALRAAAAGSHDRAAAEIFLGWGWLEGRHRARDEEAGRLAGDAAGLVGRLGDPALASELDHLRGMLAFWRGDYEGAQVALERGLALRRDALGESHPAVAPLLLDLGSVARLRGRPAEMRAAFARALALEEVARGADHPALAASLEMVAELTWEHSADAALRLFRRAHALHVRHHGERSPEAGNVLVDIALVHHK